MNNDNADAMAVDPWHALKQFTPARIALGRAGTSLQTRSCLEFQLAHALARDAVNIPLDFDALAQALCSLGYPSLALTSQAGSQQAYLQRPDLGRLLSATAQHRLHQAPCNAVDAVVVIVDGLSSSAIAQHAAPFMQQLLPFLTEQGYQMPPLSLVKHGRVAIGDAIAEHYGARLCIVLIGERPGLSSPDSMGIYFTYQAKSGISTDAERNCISNIHHAGLSYAAALKKIAFLIREAEKLQLSGVALKDETTDSSLNRPQTAANFLLD